LSEEGRLKSHGDPGARDINTLRFCKPDVTGSIPVRSIEEDAANGAFRSLGSKRTPLVASDSASDSL
jgi:hypothetical protein